MLFKLRRASTGGNAEAVLCASALDAAAFASDNALLGIRGYAKLEPDWRHAIEQHWSMRQSAETALAEIARAQGELRGYCLCCRAPARFAVDPNAVSESRPQPDWSQSLRCASCDLVSRLRFCAFELMRYVEPGGSAVYLTEQTTPLFAWLSARVKKLTGSEYFNDPAARAFAQDYLDAVHGPGRYLLRHEDITRLTFADRSFDAVMCLEVLEHVPDYRKALREFARVLRPRGVAILSAPFGVLTEHTVVRATIDTDGNVTHLLEPEYHGDPATGNGCLCYYHFGWDLLDEIRAAGFSSAEFIDVWEPAYGFLGGWAVFVARR